MSIRQPLANGGKGSVDQLRRCRDLLRQAEEPLSDDLGLAAIEAEGELVQVALEIALLKAPLKGADHQALEERDHKMGRVKALFLVLGPILSLHLLLMGVSFVSELLIAQ